MKKLITIFRRLFGEYDLDDLFVLMGGGLFTWSVWQIYPPAVGILMGAGLVWWGLAGSRKARSKR